MKRYLLSIAGSACIALLSSAAWAQEDELKDYPGYVDFGQLSGIFGEPNIEIAVGKSLLNLIAIFTANEDPEVAEMFGRLDGVRVQVFETSSLADGAFDFVKDASSKLSGSGWESVVTVNSADEQVRIFMKMNKDTVEGITVMAVEEDEAAFINVIGFLKPEELAKVMDHFDVDVHGVRSRSSDD